MPYQVVGSGTAAGLQERLPALEEALPEGSRLELRLDFRSRFPGFDQAAWLVDWGLRQAGVTPWPGEGGLVSVHPTDPRWYVRWVKGVLWGPLILAALVAVAAVMVYLTLWQLLSVVPEPLRGWVSLAIAGGVALAGAGLLIGALRRR